MPGRSASRRAAARPGPQDGRGTTIVVPVPPSGSWFDPAAYVRPAAVTDVTVNVTLATDDLASLFFWTAQVPAVVVVHDDVPVAPALPPRRHGRRRGCRS